jgi:hypothetical protein
MKNYFIFLSLIIAGGLYLIGKHSVKSNVGYTIYKPTGVKHEFVLVDLEQKQVIGKVSYKGKTYMNVHIDINSDIVQIEGSVDELGDLSMENDAYIDMFKQQAKYFIDNNIADPKAYYEELDR